MVLINWSRLATEDLKRIHRYIALDSSHYAKIQIVKIKSKTNILKLNPLLGRVVPELDSHAIRELIEGNYRIIYKTINENRIDILTVHHSSQDMTKKNI